MCGGVVAQDEAGAGARIPVGIGTIILGGGFLSATTTTFSTFPAFTRASMLARVFAATGFTVGFGTCRTGCKAERKQKGGRENQPVKRTGLEIPDRRLQVFTHFNLLH